MKNFFISYTSADRAWAEWIAFELERANYSVTIQAWDFRAGENFVADMDEGLKNSERVIIVLSPRYLTSQFGKIEWQSIIARDPTGDALVPVRIEECKVDGLLLGKIYIDLVGLDETAAREKLLADISRERGKPTSAPQFPRATRDATPPLRFPGTAPRIWNIPHNRNPNFTGRVDELNQLRAALVSEERATTRVAPTKIIAVTQSQAIHGLGGVGKTQLAVEYAHQNQHEYDIVWWLRAEIPTTLASDYARLAQNLSLKERDAQDQRIVIAAVREFLRVTSERWLLVFDNANAPEDLRDYIVESANGAVIVTSRNPNWKQIAHPLSVKPMARADAIAFLLKRTGIDVIASLPERSEGTAKQSPTPHVIASPSEDLRINSAKQSPTPSVIASREAAKQSPNRDLEIALLRSSQPQNALLAMTEDADKLADALGDLPLALEHAGAFIEASGDSFEKYLQLFTMRQREILQRAQAPANYPATVLTTWKISFDAVENESPAAAQLLNLLAFFAPDDIPMDVVAKSVGATLAVAPELSAAFADALKFDDAITTLRRYSLIENRAEKISIHRLVQAILRDRMTEDARKQFAESAAQIVRDAFPSGNLQDNPETWESCARLLPHALATADYAAALNIAPQASAYLFNQAGIYLQVRAQFADAKKSFERALAIDEASFGPNHPNVAIRVNNLGDVQRNLGDFASARKNFERVIEIFEKSLGTNHPNVATAVNNLGLVLQALGDLDGARKNFERALAIDEASFGPNHPNVAIRVNNLGAVLQALGDLDGARKNFERALAIDEASFGPNHPNVARDVNNLGTVLQALGDLDGARKNFERALAIRESAYGTNHPDVAESVWWIGTILEQSGDLRGAQKSYERAYNIYREFLGEEHSTTQNVRKFIEALIAKNKK